MNATTINVYGGAQESGNAELKASTAGTLLVDSGIQKSGNATYSPVVTTGAVRISDPLAALAYPNASYTGSPISESQSGNSTGSISPGLYSQISVSGNASLKLASGTYVVQSGGVNLSGNASVSCPGVTFIVEGGGFSVSGNATITGAGVMIFNTGSGYNASTGVDGGNFGAITLSGNGTVSLTAPTTGTYAGILIFQDRNNAKALTFSGNAMEGVTGTIYAPAAQLAESGNAQIGSASNPISLVVDTLTISGNAIANALSLTSPAGTVAYTPAQIRTAYGISALSPGRHRPDHRHRRCLRRSRNLPVARRVRQPVRPDDLRADALRPVRTGVLVPDGAQPERPGHHPCRRPTPTGRHRQLGSRGVARRRMGPCRSPRAHRSSWSRPTASRSPT